MILPNMFQCVTQWDEEIFNESNMQWHLINKDLPIFVGVFIVNLIMYDIFPYSKMWKIDTDTFISRVQDTIMLTFTCINIMWYLSYQSKAIWLSKKL